MPTSTDVREINRRRNRTLVQTRVPVELRLALSREAQRRRVSVSALVCSILIEHHMQKVVAPRGKRV